MQKLLPVFENFLYWAVAVLIIFIPLYFKFPLLGVAGTFVAIRLEDILIAASLGGLLLYLGVSGKYQQFIKDRLIHALALFFFVGLVSCFSAVFLTRTASLQLTLLHWARRVEVMMLLPLAYYSIRSLRQAKFYLYLLLGIVVLVVLYALGQKYLSFPAVSTTTSELSKGVVYYLQTGDRVSSTFAGHYDLAIFLVMAVSMLSAIVFHRFSSGIKTKAVLGIILGLAIVVLIETAARLSFVAAVFGIVASLFLIGKKRHILIALLIVAGLVVYPSQLRDRLISTFTINIKNSWQGYVGENQYQNQRSELNIPTLPDFRTRGTPTDIEVADIVPGEPTDPTAIGVYRSFTIRINIEWPRAIRALFKNPFLGTGYSSIGLATDNDFLRALGETGILGMWAFVLVLVDVFRRLVGLYKKSSGFTKNLVSGTMAMFLAFIINALFIDVFEASKIASLFWLGLGIVLSIGKTGLRKT